MYKFKNDTFKKTRGGVSRVLDIRCYGCDNHVTYYQKDGPGLLKRMYIDRFIDKSPNGNGLICDSCNRNLGTLINYEKENRPAYRLFVGAVTKKIISAKNMARINYN
jgi:hypothetical protein